MFGQFSGQQEPDSGLDFPGGDGGPFVVVSQTRSLSSNSFKDVIDKGVHDTHGLRGDSSIRMDLLQDFVDIDSIGFFAFLASSFA